MNPKRSNDLKVCSSLNATLSEHDTINEFMNNFPLKITLSLNVCLEHKQHKELLLIPDVLIMD